MILKVISFFLIKDIPVLFSKNSSAKTFCFFYLQAAHFPVNHKKTGFSKDFNRYRFWLTGKGKKFLVFEVFLSHSNTKIITG